MTRYFSPLLDEQCDGCDSSCEVLSLQEYLVCRADDCLPGDMVRCSRCQCQGWIDADEEGAYVRWPIDICAACHRRFERIIHEFSERLAAAIKADLEKNE